MSTSSQTNDPMPAESASHHTRASMWPWFLTGLSLVLLVLIAGYWQTLSSMVEIWHRSETFAHGFLIFPISAYLIWKKRRQLVRLTPEPDWRGLLALMGLGFGWLLANVVDVLVIQQMCLVAMIPVAIWTVLGRRIVWEIAFPLAFLLFAVPIGEFLIPPLMNFTADFTVAMIKLTGIPVYREGTFFSIPSGDWSVVEGCSGLRYLIASITLGCLYAYLTYRSVWRRLAFIALSMGFPVIANGLRAFMIVMIAHFSDMKLALGVDHYIYGWVFFGLVILLMFWIGSLWREPDIGEDTEDSFSAGQGARSPSLKPLAMTTALAMVVVAIWPLRSLQIREEGGKSLAPVMLSVPAGQGKWRPIEQPLTAWEPQYKYPDAKAKAVYSDGQNLVALYLLYYRTQAQGKELINSQNILIRQKHPVWKMPKEEPVSLDLGGKSLAVKQGILQSRTQKLLTWRWNWVAGTYTINDYWAKLLEAKDKLLGTPRDAAAIILATEYQETPQAATPILKSFIREMETAIDQALREAEANRGS